jgi:hypothetical protein
MNPQGREPHSHRAVLDAGRSAATTRRRADSHACWCARAMVESTDTSQVISPAASARACNAARIRAQVPSSCHRRNKPYTVCQCP